MNRRALAVALPVVLVGVWLVWPESGEAAQLRHKTGRDVVVSLDDEGVLDRLRLPGRHEIVVPCPHIVHARSMLLVDIVRTPADSAAEPDDAALFTPEQLVDACAKAPPIGRVCIVDTAKALATEEPTQADTVGVFLTAGGLHCRVAADAVGLRKAAASVQIGDKLSLWGQVIVGDNDPVLLLDGLDTGRPKPSTDEPTWHATLRWNGAEVARLLVPAETTLHLPCPHLPAATATIAIDLRRFPKVDLKVDGHDVEGRPAPLPDHGMWFVYERPFKAVFVMKTVSFPLSIAFVADDGTIVNIEKLNPGDLHRAVAKKNVRYILEMRQGWFDARRIKPGDKVEFPKPDEEI